MTIVMSPKKFSAGGHTSTFGVRTAVTRTNAIGFEHLFVSKGGDVTTECQEVLVWWGEVS